MSPKSATCDSVATASPYVSSCDSFATGDKMPPAALNDFHNDRRRLIEELESRGVRLTRQRRAVMEVIQGADRHLDAGDGKRGHGSSELSIGESGQRISAELAQGQADRRAAPGPVLDLCRATVA